MDTTLRDGEQTSGVSFSAAEKLTIAQLLLEELNIDRIEIASARVSEGEFQAVKGITSWAEEKGYSNRIEVLTFVDGGVSIDWMKKAGAKDISTYDSKQPPGLDIHEMGGVRMGNDPATSLLNKWNQLHACQNVFVTDGACMTSTGNQSPSILYMALTARAVNYAAEELKKGNL